MFPIGPRSDGSPNMKFFSCPEVIKQFNPVMEWLWENGMEYIVDDSPTNECLAMLTEDILKFQEKLLGNDKIDLTVNYQNAKIPMKYFLDLRPGGSLCLMLLTAYKYKKDQDWRRFDFPQRELSENYQQFVDLYYMYTALRDSLVKSKCYVFPKAYIQSEVDENTKLKVQNLLRRYNGTFTLNRGQATHVIYPPQEQDPSNYARPVFKTNTSVLLHHYYQPDSRDSYAKIHLPWKFDKTSLQSLPERTQYKVTANWILDMEKFSEWMSEEDYEVDNDGRLKTHKYRLTVEDFDWRNKPPLKTYSSTNRKRKVCTNQSEEQDSQASQSKQAKMTTDETFGQSDSSRIVSKKKEKQSKLIQPVDGDVRNRSVDRVKAAISSGKHSGDVATTMTDFELAQTKKKNKKLKSELAEMKESHKKLEDDQAVSKKEIKELARALDKKTEDFENMAQEVTKLKKILIQAKYYDADGNVLYKQPKSPKPGVPEAKPALARTIARKNRQKRAQAKNKTLEQQAAIDLQHGKPLKTGPRKRVLPAKRCTECEMRLPLYCLMTCGHTYCGECIAEAAGVENIEQVEDALCKKCVPHSIGKPLRLLE